MTFCSRAAGLLLGGFTAAALLAGTAAAAETAVTIENGIAGTLKGADAVITKTADWLGKTL